MKFWREKSLERFFCGKCRSSHQFFDNIGIISSADLVSNFQKWFLTWRQFFYLHSPPEKKLNFLEILITRSKIWSAFSSELKSMIKIF
jgi:hypothetical protein